VQVLATAIYDRIQASYDVPSAAALAVLFLLLVLIMLAVVGGIRRLIAIRFAGEAT